MEGERSRGADWDYEIIGRAFGIAAEAHREQSRKGSDTPYLAHLLGVAELALSFGANETEFAAALLHDTIEDSGGDRRRREIEEACGQEVASIVDSCSDSHVDTTTKATKKPWRERKMAYISHLTSPGAAPGSLLVSACDKLHNLTATRDDFERLGEVVWTRFKTGWPGQVWYYRQLLEVYRHSTDARVWKVADRIGAELAALESALQNRAYPLERRRGARPGNREEHGTVRPMAIRDPSPNTPGQASMALEPAFCAVRKSEGRSGCLI
jgi:GTP pyrophosphokinase